MAVNRVEVVQENWRRAIGALAPVAPCDLDAPVRPGTALTAREALRLFEAQLTSRWLDVVARELKRDGEGFYTIGSSGHEANAAVAAAAMDDDPAFLHYRSGPFFLARASRVGGPAGAFDVLLGMVASADEPIAGGRHKVFGSLPLAIPPQTSTIASHLPKALGCAVAIDRAARWRGADRRIAICSFGDASLNHATATSALNAAGWAAHQNVPAPVLFVCEDNGIGISVRTPSGWVAEACRARAGLRYVYGDGRDLCEAYDAACEAVAYVRRARRPAILHLRTVRLFGHAGSDLELGYRTPAELAAVEAEDPLLESACQLVACGAITPDDLLAWFDETGERVRALAREAVRRPKLVSAAQVMEPLAPLDPDALDWPAVPAGRRRELFGGELPEHSERPRHLAVQLNRALTDALAAFPDALVFGEDVARKGGVYGVTAGLYERYGVGRVFNTLLDETSILGMAIGAGHAGLLPIPEIQYLAYLHNAVDQLRGEAGSLQFFSGDQYRNPMVVRIAGLAYQKGFGGHFHNDHGIAAIREIPGLILACPSRGDDAVRMFRTLLGAAAHSGRVCVQLEPIARYMTRDLHEPGDGLWQTHYPEPGDAIPLGEVGVHHLGDPQAPALAVATFGNGVWMSLRALHRAGIPARVVDLRWLSPLPIEGLLDAIDGCPALLVVDECRASSGIADAVAASVIERASLPVRRLTAPDTYIPLGAAANLVLINEDGIARAATELIA